jgi:hypothetical protein
MANNTGWVAGRGQGVTYGSAGFTTTNFNSMIVGGLVVASSAIVNTTALDLYADLSFSLVNGATTMTVASYLSLYILPLNQDGTTYGDASVTNNSTVTPPAPQYLVASVGVPLVASAGTIVGTFRGILLPVGNFKFAISNNTAGAMAASAAAAFNYRTYNESLNS